VSGQAAELAQSLLDRGLPDKVLAVAAMLLAIRPLLRGTLGSRSHLSWKRAVVLLAGGTMAWVGAVGLLAVKARLLGGPFYVTTWLGGTLAFFGGALGVATLLAGRGPEGMTEEAAIDWATQAAAMSVYVAAPQPALALLAITRLLRALPPSLPRRRRALLLITGLLCVGLALVPRSDPTLGGLREPWASLVTQ
jgi:hypothetical protein